MTAYEFIEEAHAITSVLRAVGISHSSFYYHPRYGKRGREASTHTCDLVGNIFTETEVVAMIRTELEKEFVDYGYIKTYHWLRRHKHLMINKKKVYRIMSTYGLLHRKRRVAGPVPMKRRIETVSPRPEKALTHFEIDIKYMPIRGCRRNAQMLTVLDVKSRYNVAWMLQKCITQHDVVALFDDLLHWLGRTAAFTVRSDNGSQFIAYLVRNYFADNNITHEFIQPSQCNQNAHIESYHSIVESLICQQYQFSSIEEASDTMLRFVHFYNNERIHSGINYRSPREFLEENNIDLQQRTLFNNKMSVSI